METHTVSILRDSVMVNRCCASCYTKKGSVAGKKKKNANSSLRENSPGEFLQLILQSENARSTNKKTSENGGYRARHKKIELTKRCDVLRLVWHTSRQKSREIYATTSINLFGTLFFCMLIVAYRPKGDNKRKLTKSVEQEQLEAIRISSCLTPVAP